MATHRRYTAKQKVDAVAEAARTSLTQASESTGVPITTLKYWFDHPEFAEVRSKTREELADGSIAMALIAQGELIRRIRSGKISDQALVAVYGVGIDKGQLLLGAATERTENVSFTDGIPPHVKRALRDRLSRAARGESGTDGSGPDGAGSGLGSDREGQPAPADG